MEGLAYHNGDLRFGSEDQPALVFMYSISFQSITSSYFKINKIQITDSILDITSSYSHSCMNCVSGLYFQFYRSGTTHFFAELHNVTIQGYAQYKQFEFETTIKLPAAVYILCSDNDYTTIKLTNVTIANSNTTGIYIGKCTVEFGNVTISNNHSPFNGGGMWIGQGSWLVIEDTHHIITSLPNTAISFINNTAEGVGGAIYFGTMDTNGNPFFINCCLLFYYRL